MPLVLELRRQREYELCDFNITPFLRIKHIIKMYLRASVILSLLCHAAHEILTLTSVWVKRKRNDGK